ncbi:unnamed protein product, partial [Meganyctiphanes norvegica]
MTEFVLAAHSLSFLMCKLACANWFVQYFICDFECGFKVKTEHIENPRISLTQFLLNPDSLNPETSEIQTLKFEWENQTQSLGFTTLFVKSRLNVRIYHSIECFGKSRQGVSPNHVRISEMCLGIDLTKLVIISIFSNRRELCDHLVFNNEPYSGINLLHRLCDRTLCLRTHCLLGDSFDFGRFKPSMVCHINRSSITLDCPAGSTHNVVSGEFRNYGSSLTKFLLLFAKIYHAGLKRPKSKPSSSKLCVRLPTELGQRNPTILDVLPLSIPRYQTVRNWVFRNYGSSLTHFSLYLSKWKSEIMTYQVRSIPSKSQIPEIKFTIVCENQTQSSSLRPSEVMKNQNLNIKIMVRGRSMRLCRITLESTGGQYLKIQSPTLDPSKYGRQLFVKEMNANHGAKFNTMAKVTTKKKKTPNILLFFIHPLNDFNWMLPGCYEIMNKLSKYTLYKDYQSSDLLLTMFANGRGGIWQDPRYAKFSEIQRFVPLVRVKEINLHELEDEWQQRHNRFMSVEFGGLRASTPRTGWNHVVIPDKHTLIMDAGKLYVLDNLLSRLKAGGHRVLIYSQMTKMIDVLEEYMWHRKHKYMRLDGSSKISDRRDMVADFQTKQDIFVFLLSTRAGGVGINLTAADTVIFYDSDWNPTVDQQAMDRAHRLGQTKQVTVYRLVCKATIEERILQRATEKSQIQNMVISGGNFKVSGDALRPKEVVSLLLDDDIEKQYRARQAERRILEDQKIELNREKMRERMRKRYAEKKLERELEEKRRRGEENVTLDVVGDNSSTPLDSMPSSPTHSEASFTTSVFMDDASNDSSLIVDVESPVPPPASGKGSGSSTVRGQRKRGRPKGSGGSIRQRLGRGGENQAAIAQNQAVLAAQALVHMADSDGSSFLLSSPSPPVSTACNTKRGRGRPRLLPLGPGHQGTRTPPALPLALGSNLTQNTQQNDQKPFGYLIA